MKNSTYVCVCVCIIYVCELDLIFFSFFFCDLGGDRRRKGIKIRFNSRLSILSIAMVTMTLVAAILSYYMYGVSTVTKYKQQVDDSVN